MKIPLKQGDAKGLDAHRVFTHRAKQYLAMEEFKKALKLLDYGLISDPNNNELINLRNRIKEAETKCKEVEELWENFVYAERYGRNGRAETKIKCKEALINYYAKLDEPADNAGSYSETIDITEEIAKVYTSWRREQGEIECESKI